MSKDPHKDLNGATYVSSITTIIFGFILSYLMFGGMSGLSEGAGFKLGFVSP